MAKEEIHVQDIGTTFELTVYDIVNNVEVIVDISGVLNLDIIFVKPDDAKITKTGPAVSLTTDGTDGKFQYKTVVDDLDQAGGWKIQGKVELPDGTWFTDISLFIVWDNL